MGISLVVATFASQFVGLLDFVVAEDFVNYFCENLYDVDFSAVTFDSQGALWGILESYGVNIQLICLTSPLNAFRSEWAPNVLGETPSISTFPNRLSSITVFWRRPS